MLSVPIDRITMLLEQASQVGSEVTDEVDETEIEGESLDSATAEDFADLPAYRELTVMLDDFTPEERYQLLALAAIGRGDIGDDSWDAALERVQSVAAEEAVPELARILVATDAIENALDRLGYTFSEDDEDEEDDDDDEDEDEEEDEEEEGEDEDEEDEKREKP
jgi:hypothetical protein